ncbi:MAG: hypothetical protein AAGC60_05065 [Acidobacteriota bacterium]
MKPDPASLDRKAHLRPRFELTTSLEVDSVLDRVRAALAESDDAMGMVLDSGRIELTPHEDTVRFWSPQLTIDAERRDSGDGTVLRARFGPHPHVWTLYLALYATSVSLAIGCIMYGASQWMVGSEPWGLYLTPLALILSALVYGASYVGQGLGSLQMQELRSLVERAIAAEPADDSSPRR